MFEAKTTTVPYTVRRCVSCGSENRRGFKQGDVLFADDGDCSCGGAMRIEMIFGEVTEQSSRWRRSRSG